MSEDNSVLPAAYVWVTLRLIRWGNFALIMILPVRTSSFVCFNEHRRAQHFCRRHINEDKITTERCNNRRRDTRCTCDATIWRIRVTMQLKRDSVFCVQCCDTRHCQQYKKKKTWRSVALKKIVLWRIYVAADNKTYLGLHVRRPVFYVRF